MCCLVRVAGFRVGVGQDTLIKKSSTLFKMVNTAIHSSSHSLRIPVEFCSVSVFLSLAVDWLKGTGD